MQVRDEQRVDKEAQMREQTQSYDLVLRYSPVVRFGRDWIPYQAQHLELGHFSERVQIL